MTWVVGSVARAAAPAVLIKDTFTDTPATLITAHTGEIGATWTDPVLTYTTTAVAVISDANRLRCPASASFAFPVASGQPTAECVITGRIYVASLATSPQSRVFISFRVDPTVGTFYSAEFFCGSSTQLLFRLSRTVSNANWTELALSALMDFTAGQSFDFRIEVQNSVKILYVNGYEQCRSTDNTITAAGKVGVQFPNIASDTTGMHLDSLTVEGTTVSNEPGFTAASPVYYAIGSTAPRGVEDVIGTGAKMVAMQAWHVAEMQALKAADPTIRCFVYKDLTAVRSDYATYNGVNLWSTGLSKQRVEADFLSARLLDANGVWVAFSGWHELFCMDPASTAYRTAWADTVIAEVQTYGWDGVFADDTNATLSPYPGRPTAYPSDAAYGTAVGGFLQYLHGRTLAAGTLLLPNMGGWHENTTVMDTWIPNIDYALQEMFVSYPSGGGFTQQWTGTVENQIASAKKMADAGHEWTGICASDSSTVARFAYAVSLLSVKGSAGSGLEVTSDPLYASLPLTIAERALAIGVPAGDDVVAPAGVHVRYFTTGVVVVNNSATSQTVTLTGGPYSGSGLTSVNNVTLTTQTGVVLAKY
jgi:Hypothetical glycosyl hydrolase family 15